MAQGLERRLNLPAVIIISLSSMIGSGIFVLPGIGIEITGASLCLAFLISAICILPAAISKAELATAMPTSGGTYVYLERTFGPLAGTISGLGLFLSILLKAAFSLVGIKAYFSVLSDFDPTMVSLIFLGCIVMLNIFGIGKVSGFLTIILFTTLFSLSLLSIFALPEIRLDHFTPLMSNGFEGLASATALVFVSFAGVTKVAAIAEEIKNPAKNLPRGILISLVLVTLIYCSVSFILAGYFSIDSMAGELRPIYRLALEIGGPIIGALFAIIATLTMVNTANAGILAASRFPFAMARDKLLPSFLGKIHSKFLTPVISIILSGTIILTILFLFDVTKIAKLASAFMILIYILENISVLVLRESRAQWYDPEYKSPFYPSLQIFGIITCSVLLFGMGDIAIYAVASIAIPGLILYLSYSRTKTTRKGVIGIRGKRVDLIDEQIPEEAGFCRFDINGDAEVVVSLFGRERSPEMLVEMAISLAEHKRVEVADILEIPEQTDIHDFVDEPASMRSLRRRIHAMAEDKNESITYDPIISHDVAKTVFEISQRLHCNWMVLEWGGRSRGTFTVHSPVGWLKSHLYCNIAMFRDAGVRYIRKIIVYLERDNNEQLILATADHLAEVHNARVCLTYYEENSKNDEAMYETQSLLKEKASQQKLEPSTKVITGENKLQSILKETCDYDLFIIGIEQRTFLKSLTGTFKDKLIAKASCSVLAVHKSSKN